MPNRTAPVRYASEAFWTRSGRFWIIAQLAFARLAAKPALDADQFIEDYRHLIKLTNPEIVPYPDRDLVRLNRHLIRHTPMSRSSCQPWPANQIGCSPTIRSTSRTPSLNGRRCALQRQQSSFGRCRRYSGRGKLPNRFADPRTPLSNFNESMPTESNLQESLREIIQRGSSSGRNLLSTTASLRIAPNSASLLCAVSLRSQSVRLGESLPEQQLGKFLTIGLVKQASSDADSVCRRSNPDSGKTRCVACRC